MSELLSESLDMSCLGIGQSCSASASLIILALRDIVYACKISAADDIGLKVLTISAI